MWNDKQTQRPSDSNSDPDSNSNSDPNPNSRHDDADLDNHVPSAGSDCIYNNGNHSQHYRNCERHWRVSSPRRRLGGWRSYLSRGHGNDHMEL